LRRGRVAGEEKPGCDEGKIDPQRKKKQDAPLHRFFTPIGATADPKKQWANKLFSGGGAS
jgi:hypothetical protein